MTFKRFEAVIYHSGNTMDTKDVTRRMHSYMSQGMDEEDAMQAVEMDLECRWPSATIEVEEVSEIKLEDLTRARVEHTTECSIWYMYMLLLTVAFTLIVGVLGYVLCFEATTLGGWLPFICLTIGPAMGWTMRTVAGTHP